MSASGDGRRVVIRNRKARHEYEILDTFEAGLVLKGGEVKSLRDGKANFTDAFATVTDGEVWLHNLHINPYPSSTVDAPDPKRDRKLLLRKSQIEKLAVETRQRGLTLVPLDLYFTRGVAKVTLALAKGKKLHDKREALKHEAMKREAEREIEKHQS